MSILSLQGIQISFGGLAILNDLNLRVQPKERIGLLGRNGAGKSTLMKLIAGEIHADSGEINKSTQLKIARLVQDVPAGTDGTIFEVVASGLGELTPLLESYHRVLALVSEDPTEQNLQELEECQHALEAANGWRIEQMVDQYFEDSSAIRVSAEAIGLDARAGYLFISIEEGWIASRNTRSLEYYGGFEYIGADYKVTVGEITFYSLMLMK